MIFNHYVELKDYLNHIVSLYSIGFLYNYVVNVFLFSNNKPFTFATGFLLRFFEAKETDLSILIKNIKGLVQVREGDEAFQPLKGKSMQILPVLENAWLLLDEGEGKIKDYGKMDAMVRVPTNYKTIDATGKFVVPSYVDAHTHIVYAGSREGEFVDRIKGLSYQEIAEKGGGILNSAKKLQEATEAELYASAIERIGEIIRQGTGAVEIKSGYGLSVESELKMLRVIRNLKKYAPIPIKATFLGAHAVPKSHPVGAGSSVRDPETKEAYIKLILEEMLPTIAKEYLADYCDVFCEDGYFNMEETILILEEANKYGIKGKVHAEQLSHSGGTEAGVKSNAISVDHLEYLNDDDIKFLKENETIPVILPGAQFFLQLPHPPVRKMLDAGLPLAISSDYNPGSSPSGNMNLMIALACIQYKMTPEEAFNSATMNSAAAMGVLDKVGSVTRGKLANIFITKEMPSYSFIPYSFGSNLIETIILNGKIYP